MKQLFLTLMILMGITAAMAEVRAQEVKWNPIKLNNEVVYWSDSLSGGPFANCISEKEDDKPSSDHSGWAICKSENGIDEGTSKDKNNNLYVSSSDAIDACNNITNKDMNGKKLVVTLPNKEEYLQSKDNPAFAHLFKSNELFWLSTTLPNYPNGAFAFSNDNYDGWPYSRSKPMSVRCIAHIK